MVPWNRTSAAITPCRLSSNATKKCSLLAGGRVTRAGDEIPGLADTTFQDDQGLVDDLLLIDLRAVESG
jgi:hypothetical protein